MTNWFTAVKILDLDDDGEIEIDQIWVNKVQVKDYKFNITANS